MSGTLYVVPTPIGNLEDITLRALRVLKEVDLIACEDTRQTSKLLNHFAIQKPLVSFYSYNQSRRLPEIMHALADGKNVALVSDSGMPGVSDPGALLVAKAAEENVPVTVLPGPNAAVTALVGSALPSDGFVFLGFLRRKPGKMKKELKAAAAAGKTIVFYESPHRVKKTLAVCEEVFGPETRAAVARELSKKFEEYLRGTLAGLRERLGDAEVRGEIVVLVTPESVSEEGPEETGREEEPEGDEE